MTYRGGHSTISVMNSQKVVTPVDPGSSPGGVQMIYNYLKRLDSTLAGMTEIVAWDFSPWIPPWPSSRTPPRDGMTVKGHDGLFARISKFIMHISHKYSLQTRHLPFFPCYRAFVTLLY